MQLVWLDVMQVVTGSGRAPKQSAQMGVRVQIRGLHQPTRL